MTGLVVCETEIGKSDLQSAVRNVMMITNQHNIFAEQMRFILFFINSVGVEV